MAKMKNLLRDYLLYSDGIYRKTIHIGDLPVTLHRDAHGRLLGTDRHHTGRALAEMPDEINRNRRMDGRPAYAR